MVTLISIEKRPWINTRRLHAHGLVLAVCLWGTFAWIMSGPGAMGRNGLLKGTDFLHFYTLGSLALEHRGAELYDMAAQSELGEHRVPEAGRTVFVALYGPQVSLLFAPLAALPYGVALTLWLGANAVLYAWCCYAVWKRCLNLQRDGSLAFLLALAYPAFFHLLLWGQSSGLALLCFTASYLALRSNRKFLAGLAIGCLMVKPQLGLAAAFVFLATGEWRVVLGAAASALASLLMGWLYYGTAVLQSYLSDLQQIREIIPLLEPRLYQMHSLRAFWSMLLPWQPVAFWFYVVSAVLALSLTLLCWRSHAALALKFAALLFATVLVSPHLTVYDLVILAPAFLVLADWARGKGSIAEWMGPLLYLCYLLPLAGPLARWTHLQFSVLAMVTLLWVLFRNSTGGYGEATT